MRVIALLIALALVAVACGRPAVQERQAQTQEVVMPDKLTTTDGKSIAYTYYPGAKGQPGAILLHQLRRDRHDYDTFAPQLKSAGYNVISIDVRGHGESTGNWELFSESDFRKVGLDIAAAKGFLQKNGAGKGLLLIGASFSANAVINHAAQDRDVTAVIAISPGLDFRGIKPLEGIENAPNATLLVAAEDDAYSAESVRTLYSKNTDVETKIYAEGGHGYAMFGQTTLAKDILAWLKNNP
ncbi:alpha/beta hydrolase [Candidatus Woesearchaeota archaeon]|nr:alpha/beta hydrolase [Candidatus Woesearchaeota archaeon]